jgi:hypothetical protein
VRRRGWLVAMAGVLAAVAGCAPSVTYRYRLTVEVETPDGMRSGSSVIETNIHDTTGNWWALGEARRVSSRVRGEAVFVDLGSGRNVVALLARGPQADQGIDFNWLVPNTLHVDPLKDPASLLRRPGRHEVPAHLVPTLVTFADVADPKSARVVYATGSVMSGGQQPRVVRETVLVDDFAGAFGPGYRFLRATVEIVPTGIWLLNSVGLSGQPVTHTIEKKLPWWHGPGRPAAVALRAAGLTAGSFLDAELIFKRN